MLNYAAKDDVLIRIPPSLPLKMIVRIISTIWPSINKKVLEVIPERHRPIFDLQWNMGTNSGGRALMKDCITDQEVIIRRSFSEFELRETTKTGRIRRFSLTSRATSIIKSMPLSTCPLFYAKYKNGISSTPSQWDMHKACAEVGIKIKLYNAFATL